MIWWNRLKGLDLVGRVPEELWTEVCNIVQEAVTETNPKKKKCKKAKCLSEETLQIAEERREAKNKGERERYTQLNAEFQRAARRDKKTFFSLPAILWNSAFRWIYLSFSPCLSLLFLSQLFVRPLHTAILPFCISFSWGSWTMLWTSVHSSSAFYQI